MIEIDDALAGIQAAKDYAAHGDLDAAAQVLQRLAGRFPASYRWTHVSVGMFATDWADWDAIEREVMVALNALIVTELRRRDRVAADNRAKARKPRISKYAWMQEIAEEMVKSRPNASDNQLAVLVLDRIQTETENAEDLPSDRTIRGWLKKLRAV